ncbi:hypothetical protein LQE92_06265 [Lacrimispora sp. NSJ-141]|uniref:DUF2029 domain-containing protein n=1 Tax=Lientehia hominis TaxID=2897778 RepID=A0AAP2RK22_9FIRM|nr:hypothetical protein [Lientehia hominis]MCD2492233.1 hypothetical protein [Lientehia hominis]
MKLDVNKIKKSLFIGTLVFQLILFFCFVYGDVFITTNHGMNFWDCLFSGNIRNFYSYNLNSELVAGVYRGNYSAYYDFMIYIIFALWDLPLWIIKKVFKIEFILNTFWGSVWAKSIILLFLILTLCIMIKIVNIIQKDKHIKIRSIYLFLTSVFVTAYICILGQYDIIPIFFILAGVYFFLKNKFRLFVLFFALAIPIKAFALFAFVVLLLYKEKNILKDILWIICGLLPMALTRWLVPIEGSSNINILYELLFQNKIDLTYGGVPIFVIVFVVLCLFCYLKKPSEDEQLASREIIYLCFLAFAVFLTTCSTLPYWFLYMVPFLYIIIAGNKNYYTINMLLETCMAFFVVLGQVFTFYWCFSGDIVGNMFLSLVLKRGNEVNLSAPMMLEKLLGAETYQKFFPLVVPICMAIFIAAVIVFSYLNSPWKREKVNTWNDSKVNKMIYGLRILLGYGICMIPLVCYLL